MPIYEFVCPSCEKEMELILKISESNLETCPECGGSGLKKKASMTSFTLKGGGWYKDGYSKDNKPAPKDPKPPTA